MANEKSGKAIVGMHDQANEPAARCLKCRVLCTVSILDHGYCPICLAPARAAAVDMLLVLKEIDGFCGSVDVLELNAVQLRKCLDGVMPQLRYALHKAEEDQASLPRLECNCENSKCGHGDKSCGASGVTGEYRVEDLGAVCKDCYEAMDPKWRLPRKSV